MCACCAAHASGTFSVGWDPMGDYVATAGADGLKIWGSLNEPQPAKILHYAASAVCPR